MSDMHLLLLVHYVTSKHLLHDYYYNCTLKLT